MISKPRPGWKEDFNRSQTEWTLYDSETDRMKFCEAADQKEAIKKALAFGIQPRKSMDVKPRDGGVSQSLMKPYQFRSFMDSLSG